MEEEKLAEKYGEIMGSARVPFRNTLFVSIFLIYKHIRIWRGEPVRMQKVLGSPHVVQPQ